MADADAEIAVATEPSNSSRPPTAAGSIKGSIKGEAEATNGETNSRPASGQIAASRYPICQNGRY